MHYHAFTDIELACLWNGYHAPQRTPNSNSPWLRCSAAVAYFSYISITKLYWISRLKILLISSYSHNTKWRLWNRSISFCSSRSWLKVRRSLHRIHRAYFTCARLLLNYGEWGNEVLQDFCPHVVSPRSYPIRLYYICWHDFSPAILWTSCNSTGCGDCRWKRRRLSAPNVCPWMAGSGFRRVCSPFHVHVPQDVLWGVCQHGWFSTKQRWLDAVRRYHKLARINWFTMVLLDMFTMHIANNMWTANKNKFLFYCPFPHNGCFYWFEYYQLLDWSATLHIPIYVNLILCFFLNKTIIMYFVICVARTNNCCDRLSNIM